MAVPRARLGGPFGGPSIRTRNELSIEPILDAVSRGATGLIQNAYLRKRQKQQDEMIAAEKAAAQAQAVQDRLERVQTEDRRYQLDLRKLTSDEARQRAADEKAARDEAAKLIAPVGRMTDPVDGTVYNIDAQGRASPAVTTDGQPFRLKVPPRPGTSTTRNIDPLSPEGIKAAKDRAQALLGVGGGVGAGRITEGERKNAAFYNQAIQANALLEGMDIPTKLDAMAASVPLIGRFGTSGDYQKLEQASLQLADAWLRATSGAAVPEQEVQRAARAFMPIASDKPEVKAQKAAARKRILESLKMMAGNAMPLTKPQAPLQPPGFGANAPPGAPPTAPPVPPADTSSVPPVGPNMIRLKNGTVVPIRR